MIKKLHNLKPILLLQVAISLCSSLNGVGKQFSIFDPTTWCKTSKVNHRDFIGYNDSDTYIISHYVNDNKIYFYQPSISNLFCTYTYFVRKIPGNRQLIPIQGITTTGVYKFWNSSRYMLFTKNKRDSNLIDAFTYDLEINKFSKIHKTGSWGTIIEWFKKPSERSSTNKKLD